VIPIKTKCFSENGKQQWILSKVIRSKKGVSKEKKEVEDGRGCAR
jgi:hypothetical protein